MSLKPGPKPVAPLTGELDQCRRDNKNTPRNTDKLNPVNPRVKNRKPDICAEAAH